jgi:hypothetical protein
VASSCSASPTACAEAALRRNLGPRTTDTKANEISEGGELGANQVLDFDPPPFVPNEEVLIGCKRLDALGKSLDEMFGSPGRRLVSDRVHDAEHVLRTMIDLAHQEVVPFQALLAFGNLLDGADKARALPLTPGALETSKPTHLHPADFAVSPLNPILPRGALRIGGIERCLAICRKPFRIVRMYQLLEASGLC